MDKEALVEQEIILGQRVLQALDQAKIPVIAALWNFLPDADVWRLVIASPKVKEVGPKETYVLINDVLRKGGVDLPLHSISVVDPDDPLITELRIFAGTDPAPFIGSTYLQKSVIGDMYIEGAYIYRADRIVGKSGTFEMLSAVRDKARNVWTARPCNVTFEDGFFKKIEVGGFNWPQTQAKNGLNARLDLLSALVERNGETFADVRRWTIQGGRLRAIDTFARNVRVLGYAPAASPVSVSV